MGCAASSRIQPHPAQVAEDRKATAEFERQLAKARAAQEAMSGNNLGDDAEQAIRAAARSGLELYLD